jgi:hypothetical protein
MSNFYAERQIDPQRADDPQYAAKVRFELFVFWHRAAKQDVDTSQHYLIGKFGQPPREALRLTRVASIAAVEWEPNMQPIARDQVALYAEEIQRWASRASSFPKS